MNAALSSMQTMHEPIPIEPVPPCGYSNPSPDAYIEGSGYMHRTTMSTEASAQETTYTHAFTIENIPASSEISMTYQSAFN